MSRHKCNLNSHRRPQTETFVDHEKKVSTASLSQKKTTTHKFWRPSGRKTRVETHNIQLCSGRTVVAPIFLFHVPETLLSSGVEQKNLFCRMCEPMETAQFAGDDTCGGNKVQRTSQQGPNEVWSIGTIDGLLGSWVGARNKDKGSCEHTSPTFFF